MARPDTIRAGLDVYDRQGRYIGIVTRVYPVPEHFAAGGKLPATLGDFGSPSPCLPGGVGCFKVQRGPLPFLGPPPLLVPFDAVLAVMAGRLFMNVLRGEAGRWESGPR